MIHEEIKILNDIAQRLHNISNIEYDFLQLTYKFNPSEGWTSLSLQQSKDNKNIVPKKFESNNFIPLCEELHASMQSTTGGDWRKFILTIDNNGEAKTEFSYEIQSCLDQFK